METNLEFFIERSYEYDGYTVHLLDRYQNERRLAEPLIMRPVEQGYRHTPTFVMSHEEASRLMDALWLVGIRPSNGAGSHATHEAQNKHITDLEKIVFSLLERD